MGGDFREKLKDAPRNKFWGFKFCSQWHDRIEDDVVNFELGTCTKTFGKPILENSYYANARFSSGLIFSF